MEDRFVKGATMKEKNRKNWRISVLLAGMTIALTWVWAPGLQALKYPHNPGYVSNPVSCDKCHSSAAAFKSLTSLDVMCINASGCHNSSGKAGKKRLTTKSASNRFLSLPVDPTAKQSSHGWDIPNTNPDAGATNYWYPAKEYNGWTPLKNRISCTRCHRAHGDMMNVPIYRSFLKGDPTGDDICFQCHAARRVNNVRDALPSSSLHYSHPVEVNYSSARAKPGKSSLYFRNPTSSFPTNPSAKLKLYTTKAGVKGAVVCSTCHAPIHSADSNPYTFDNLTTYASGNYSTSAGNLLRRYPMSKSDDICISCHKVTTHRTFKCNRCHTPHKKAGENNRYLILENISTPYSGRKDVQFISTSAMAFRYTNSVPGKSAICQVCHTGTEKTLNHHYNYSSNTVDRSHNYDQPSGKYLFCAQCHVHSAGFAASGPAACGSCHKSPPNDTYGKHGKHVGTNGTYDWSSADLSDSRSSSVYGFSCGRCHSKWAPYTSSASYPRHQPASGYDDDSFGRYTAEVGFLTLSTMTKDPASARNVLMNPGATYTYGARGTGMDFGNVSTAGTSGSWWSWPTTGTCNNLYCHGQFFNGYTANNPTWQGTQTCGKCHGVAQELGMGIPGRTGSVSYGAHQRHVGAGTQEYGQLSPRFRCNACHNATSGMNNATTLNKNNHVNGRTNVKFDAAYGDSASAYGYAGSWYNNYSGKTNRSAASPKTVYKTCSWIYCHSDGSRLMGSYSGGGQVLAFKYPNWSSTRNFTTTQSSTKRRCSRCHGADRVPGTTAFSGITAAMPGYASRTGKGNSHYKHVVENGFKCDVCHSRTVNSNNISIMFTYSSHINKRYDVDIKSSYGGTYNSVTHKCSNVECHALITTPAWGNPANCQDCHMSNTSDTDKRIVARSKFTGWTSSAPKIYSTQWTQRGHGRQFGNYTKSGNAGANQACGACHRASVSHGTGSNPFRLITAPDRPNIVCNKCHGVGGSGASRTGILTHASSVTSNKAGTHNYEIKCIDCHDPHGDNNIFMLHSTLPRPGVMARDVASGKYGIITSTSQSVNVDFVNNVYTSDYAKKRTAPKVCQQCHDETKKPSTTDARFRYNTSVEKDHGSGKCTGCHLHTAGFRGAGCNGCHGYPPTGTFNLLSGNGRVNTTKKSPSGSSASESKQFGAHSTHISIYGRDGSTSCIKCHYSGMWDGGPENTNIDLEFRFDIYTGGATQKYRGLNAVATGNYGYAGNGAGAANDTQRCESMKCHGGGGWLTASYGNVTAPKWDAPATARCGKCHGAKKAAGSGSWPTSKAHTRHAGTGTSPVEYDFMCKLCHNATVQGTATTLDDSVHVNARANFAFNSAGDNRVDAGAYNGDVTVNSGFGTCEGIYCHSRGTDTAAPYDGAALPNYTANWNDTASGKTGGKPCSYCHGNKTFGGITAAMPTQSGQAHAKHARNTNGDSFRCNVCHANVVDASGNIISRANHVNKFKNISVIKTYKTANEGYLDATKKCSSIKCHGERTTPAWNSTAACTDCHYSTASPEDSFSWQNYSGTVARIYSTEWMKRGHGKTKVSGKYPFSNNTGAGKSCTICHTTVTRHNDGTNYFRLRTTVTVGDSNKLCLACHGTGTELGKMGAGTFGKITGIVSHTYENISTLGDWNGGAAKAGWNFTPKCVDCHDPHGDNNNAMLHRYVNMTGSDPMGRPTLNATAQVTYTAVNGQINWSSFVRSGSTPYTGICQRCHSAEVENFDKAQYGAHNNGSACKNCHKHKKGFAPSGCDSCHGYPPPNSPITKGWSPDSLTNKSSVHQPHAYNPRSRPGIPTENDLTTGKGYKCNRCHGGVAGSADNGQSTNHDTGAPSKQNAAMKNMTMVYGDWSPGANAGYQSVADDTCRNVTCHTPRYYTRGWKKPVDCDDCHGYTKGKGAANRVFNLQTTQSHKMHINYTGTTNLPASWKKNYNFACSNCHYNWQTNNNYSTHYSGQVNITSAGPVNTVGGQFYTRGRQFKGFTTGGEITNTTYCDRTYCHGNFTNGTTGTRPSWKKGVSTITCTSCHKGKASANMPERHTKHSGSAEYNFTCQRCHVRTVQTTYTVIFNYSSHVNTRKDVNFDNTGGIDNTAGTFNSASRFCSNTYCHSKGADKTAPFNTRSSFPNFTAKWGHTPVGYKTNTGLRAKCNYCHGNKTWTGTTSAMPNYSTEKNKANSHRKHVINNRIACSTCHFGITANNTTIANKTAHANRFYNISIDPSFVSVAGKRYSTNWTAPIAGGTCMRNTCHGNAATPRWGTSIACIDCHTGSEANDKPIKTVGNGPNPVNFQQYTLYGHGRRTGATYPSSANSGAGKWNNSNKVGCYNTDSPVGCHASAAGHMTKDTADPFRLGAYANNTNGLCLSCHDGAGGSPESALDPAHHTAVQLGSSRTWPFTPKCVDCHDPHGDSNLSMIRGAVNTPRAGAFNSYTEGGGSGVFGNPTGIGEITAVTFSSRAGKAAGSYASNTAGTGICEICHSNKISPAVNWYNRQGDSNKVGTSHETRTGACSPTCHKHSTGFKGAGESTGGTKCSDCHDLYGKMRTGNSYHHVMNNDSAVYKNKTAFSATETGNLARRCLMCHVDHDAFNPSVKSSNKRAANLRRNATLLTNKTGVATDFWPAKRTGSGAGSYAETKPIGGPSGSNGVCISCHKSVQYKNTTLQEGSQGGQTPNFTLGLYSSSSHNFQVISGMNKFSDNSRFRANCSKCHGSYYMNKTDGAQGREEFGLHDSKYQSVNRPLGGNTSIPAPYYSKNLCFNCHSRDVRQSYDYYSSIKMNSSAKLIKTADEGKTYRHPVGANSDKHRPDEYNTAAAGWNNYIDNSNGNEVKHVECVDCHNTHGGNAALVRNVGSPTGNRIAGAQYGVWGIQTSGNWPAVGAQPNYRKIAQITYQYELCAKCHSKFAWNNNSAIYATYTTATTRAGWRLTDVMKEFNPNNYGFHPVVKIGKNQPAETANTNWPPAEGDGLKWRDGYNNISGYANLSGLDWAMVPPWNRRSTMGCTDCHQVDTTGKAVSFADYASVVLNGGWGTPGNLTDIDTAYATSSGTTSLEFDVNTAGWTGNADAIYLSVWVKSSAGSSQNLSYDVKKAGSSIKPGTIVVTKASTGLKKYRVVITPEMTTNTCLTASCVNTDITVVLTGVASVTFSVDRSAIEGEFTMSEPLRGPHGSMKRWILSSANKQIWVDWDDNGTYSAGSEKPNDNIPDGGPQENTFCYNCHRRDVYVFDSATPIYNDKTNNFTYSRFKHWQVQAGGGPAAPEDAALGNVFKIPCMTCHGGGKLGAIHGDWQTTWEGYSLPRPASVRLLNGAGAHLAASTTNGGLSCYVNGGSPLGACGTSHTPKTLASSDAYNYSYTSY